MRWTVQRTYILKDIEVYLVCEGDELDRIEIEKHVEEKYRHLIGRGFNHRH